MGYYSLVGIKCELRAYERFEKVFKDYPTITPDEISKSGHLYNLKWNSIKWYNGYEDIDAVENVMDWLDEHDEKVGYGYSFIRLGEEYSDIEERENSTDMDLYFIRDLDFGTITEYIRKEN